MVTTSVTLDVYCHVIPSLGEAAANVLASEPLVPAAVGRYYHRLGDLGVLTRADVDD
jgi:hypothetical protein